MTEKSESERTLNYTEISKMARAFMRNWDTAVLSTYQLYDEDSYPFGSITPFVLSDEGDVIILISDLANHTKNILKKTARHEPASRPAICLLIHGWKLRQWLIFRLLLVQKLWVAGVWQFRFSRTSTRTTTRTKIFCSRS